MVCLESLTAYPHLYCHQASKIILDKSCLGVGKAFPFRMYPKASSIQKQDSISNLESISLSNSCLFQVCQQSLPSNFESIFSSDSSCLRSCHLVGHCLRMRLSFAQASHSARPSLWQPSFQRKSSKFSLQFSEIFLFENIISAKLPALLIEFYL